MKFIALSVLLLSAWLSKGQNASINRQLYRVAFEKFTIEIDSFYAKYGNPNAWRTLYLRDNDFLDSIPKAGNNRDVIIVQFDNRDSLYKSNHNHLVEIKVSPIYLDRDVIEIVFTPYVATRVKKNRYKYGLSDWTIIYFHFNCETRRWEYLRSHNGGV